LCLLLLFEKVFNCLCLDSNCGPLVSEATGLQIVPPPLPNEQIFRKTESFGEQKVASFLKSFVIKSEASLFKCNLIWSPSKASERLLQFLGAFLSQKWALHI